MDTSLSTIGWLLVFIAVGVGVWMVWPQGGDAAAPDFEGGFELVYRMHLEEARASPAVSEDETDTVLVGQTMRTVRLRLRALGVEQVHVRREGDENLVITLSDDARDRIDDVMATISPPEIDTQIVRKLGHLDLRLVVEPWEATKSRAEGAAVRPDPPPRLWPDDREAFDAYVLDEMLRWQETMTDGLEYTPSRERFRLVRKEGTAGENGWDFVVVAEPQSSADRFDASIFEDAKVVRSSSGYAVRLTIAEPFRRAFADFTWTNRGLRLAVILNGEASATPVIMDRISDAILLSSPSKAAAEELARLAVEVAAIGPLRVRLGLVEERPRQ